jgi:ribosomal protein S18 acetylase RimI-like enzyme
VTRFRTFRNSDPPALVKLWNQAIPESGAVRPLRVHELDAHALGTVNFEATGLIVAEQDGRIVGFVHAGFGPELPVESTQPFQLSNELGTVAMLVVEPDLNDPELAAGLIAAAERYLQDRGAKVMYAGGLFPLNPFYWGLYGGSEGSGVLAGHHLYPRAAVIRRQTQLEFIEDAPHAHWWQNVALGEFPTMLVRLLSRADSALIAHALAWDMSWFGRTDGHSRIGLIDLEVLPEHRRKGYARFLVSEIFRRARENMVASVAVQTSAVNEAALSLYASLGFQPVEEATLYRLPSLASSSPGRAEKESDAS